MNNYGEAWAYWYLRLNGFFPLDNFVVHKDSVVRHRAASTYWAFGRLMCLKRWVVNRMTGIPP